MKKAEILFAFIAIIALIFRLLQFSESFVFLLSSMGLLAMLYYPLGLLLLNDIGLRDVFKKESYKGKSILRLVGSGLAGGIFSVLSIGLLFKFETYPGSDAMLFMGLVGLIVVLVVSATKLLIGKDAFYKSILKRVLVFGSLSVIFLSIPSKTWLSWKYPNDPEYVVALANSLDNPSNKELREIEQSERQKMYERGDEIGRKK